MEGRGFEQNQDHCVLFIFVQDRRSLVVASAGRHPFRQTSTLALQYAPAFGFVGS